LTGGGQHKIPVGKIPSAEGSTHWAQGAGIAAKNEKRLNNRKEITISASHEGGAAGPTVVLTGIPARALEKKLAGLVPFGFKKLWQRREG